jgi:hypothetical protein
MIFVWWNGHRGSRTGRMQTGAMPCGLTPWEKVIHVQHERVNLVAAQFVYIEVGKKGKTGLRIESRDNEVYLLKTTSFMWTISQSLSKRSRKMHPRDSNR